VIYGLTLQRVGSALAFRCPLCWRPLVRESTPTKIAIRCEQHPEYFGEWPSEVEMEWEKIELAKCIGLL
jgi:hypothetical protein